MPKKRRTRPETLAETITALAPSPPEDDRRARIVDPMADRGFTDAEGCHWTLSRGPLDRRRAKRMAAAADLMALSGPDHYDEATNRWIPAFLPEADRPAAWLEIQPLYEADGMLSHVAYEFTAEDGRVLLYIRTSC